MRVGVEAGCYWNQRGFGRFVRNLLPEMISRNPDDEFVLFMDDRPAAMQAPNATLVKIVSRTKVVDAAVDGSRRALLDVERFRVAAGRAGLDVMFFPAVYSWFPLRRGMASVVTFHDTIAHRFPEQVFPRRWNRWLWNVKSRLAARQATRVLTVSESACRDVVEWFGLDPSRVDVMTEAPESSFRPVRDPGRLAAVRARLGIPPGGYLLFVGGLSPHKNLSRLLDAVARMPEDAGAHLVIAGDPGASGFHSEYDVLHRRVETSSRIRRLVHFTGFVPEEDLPALYSGAMALIMPSLSEGFGLPAVEAMACGTPVLASRGGALPETVGEAGLFFDALDVAGMTEAMRRILADEALRARLSKAALERASTLSWSRAADQAMASIRSCLASR